MWGYHQQQFDNGKTRYPFEVAIGTAWDENGAEYEELQHICGDTINNNLVVYKRRYPFEVAMGIAWDKKEAEQRELEHIGDTTIKNNLATVERGIHLKLP